MTETEKMEAIWTPAPPVEAFKMKALLDKLEWLKGLSDKLAEQAATERLEKSSDFNRGLIEGRVMAYELMAHQIQLELSTFRRFYLGEEQTNEKQ